MQMGLRASAVRLPHIELANGQHELVHALRGPVKGSVEGVNAELIGRRVDAKGAYDVLLGQDWLGDTASTADFKTHTYMLGHEKVTMRQRGRQLEVLPCTPLCVN